MKRLVLAMLALALLAPAALSRTGGGGDGALAQTATGPAFASIVALYRLDAGADGSSTAISVGTPAFTAGTVSGGTDACTKGNEFLNGNRSLSPFITTGGTASNVFRVSSACEITYVGAATASTVTSSRAGWSLTVTISDGVDSDGNTDATADGTILVTIKLLDAATDLAAAKALYDGAGGASWTTATNWSFEAETTIATFSGTAATSGQWTGYSRGSGGFGTITSASESFTHESITYTVARLHWRQNITRVAFGITPQMGGANFAAMRLRVGTAATTSALGTAPTSNFGSSGGGTGYLWTATGISANPFTSGSAYSVTLLQPAAGLASDWHGVTLTSGRMTALDLSNNNLTGAIPAAMGELTGLTSLDLSDNAGLTGSIPAALTRIPGLTNLDLSGTGVCVDPAAEPEVETWLSAIRATGSNTGVAKAPTCGSPAAAGFTAEAVTLGLEDGADGSTTAIAVGTPAFAQGTFAGGSTGAVCSITSARTNASNDPDDWLDSGGVADVSGDFAIDGATCLITYTGSGITSQANTLEAVSIGVSITDGIDPEAGIIDDTADDTVEVTVKLRGLATDREAIDAFHTATGGASWTNNAGGWRGERTLHTFELTAATSGTNVGYDSSGGGSAYGSVRNDSASVAVGSTTFTVTAFIRDTAANTLSFYVSPKAQAAAGAFAGLTLRVGSTDLDFDSAAAITVVTNWHGWRWTTTASFTAGDVDVALREESPPLDSLWHGVTVSGTPGRVTALELPDNNLRGALPASFADLDRIATLDLSGNAGIAGNGAVPVTAIAALQRLTSLNLGGIGWTSLGSGLGSALGALATLDLSGNRLSALPADLGMLTTLTTLDLSGNRLGGEAPGWLGDLTALTTLDLSGNRFTDVHDDLGALTALTTLDLSGNRLANADFAGVATTLASMTALTSLDLSGNASLTGSIPAALLTLNLESLDLTGTGICVDPATETAVETWLDAIRARNTNTGVARAPTCGAPAAPAFAAASARASLEAGADGSTTAIDIGRPTFTAGSYSGGATPTCAIATAKENDSYAPADFTTTGADVTGFAVAASGTTCAITYTGSGLTSTTSLVAVSIAVTVSDGVDPAEGTISDDADDTINVTVKLVGRATDRIALGDLYRSARGSGWTAAAGWPGRPRHTFGLTAGSGTVTATLGAGNGYQATGTGSGAIGSVRSGGTFTLNDIPQPGGNTLIVNYELRRLVQLANGNVLFVSNQGSQPASRWDSLSFRIGTTTLAFSAATSTVSGATRHWTWTGQPAGLIPSSGDFDVLVVDSNPGLVTGSWHGVTVSGGRVTELDLRDNNLSGTLPDSFADLSALTSLDLGGNPGLRGPIPGVLGSLAALTSLDLGSSGWSGAIPAELGSLPSLTTLALGANALSGDIPSELGSLTGLRFLSLIGNRDLGGDLSHLTSLTAMRFLSLRNTRFCVNPITDTAVESWLNGIRTSSMGAPGFWVIGVRTCGSPAAPRLADDAATYLLDVGADGSSTPIPVGEPAFTGGSYSGGMDGCTIVGNALANPSADPASFLTTGTSVVQGFVVDETNCAITWTGSSAPTRTAGTREAVSIRLLVSDGVNARGWLDPTADDRMQVTVKLVDLATDRIGLEALHDGTNGDNWNTRTGWKSSTLGSSWHGVTVASGRVTALALPDNGLSGGLPALLGDLSALTSLNLSGNRGLSGGIPREFARLRNLTRLDLRNTRVCARNAGGAALNAWLNAIRAKPGGVVRLGSCPSPAPLGFSAGITLREEGPDAPSGLRYPLRLTCGSGSVAISLGAGERYAAALAGGAACTLTVLDRLGATEVRGEFSGRSLAGDVTVTIVRGGGEEDEPRPLEGPNPELERALVQGFSFARWRAAETPVADAVGELSLCVTAVYWWNARTQSWRAWFPGADGLGVNTLAALREGGIYVFAAEERTRANCGLLPAAAGS